MFRLIRDEFVQSVAHGDGTRTIVGLAGVFGNVELWQQPFEILHQRRRTIATTSGQARPESLRNE
jgi:hypothetical protein